MPSDARTSLCLSCRTALGSDEDCDICEDGPVVSLASKTGRAAACDAAWQEEESPPPEGWFRRNAAYLKLLGGVFGIAVVAMMATALSGSLDALIAVTGVAIWAGVMALVFGRVVARAWRESKGHPTPDVKPIPVPVGTTLRLRPADSSTWLVGTVNSVSGDESSAAIAAELLELWVKSPKAVTLRDAHTPGLTIDLDDGRQVMIGAGRIRVIAKRSQLARARRDYIRRRLDEIDPLRSERKGDPLPYEEGRTLQIKLGERVEVAGELHERSKREADYRKSATATLVASGVVWLRKSQHH